MATLTPQIVEQARALRTNHVGWHTVSKRTGISEYILRREIEPHFLADRLAQQRRHTARTKAAVIVKLKREAEARKRAAAPHVVTAADRIPPDVAREAEQRKIALERRSLTESFFGDPPKGWRALDQRARR
jgi:hypothetical protein